jgi:hypothetical protein
LPTEELIPLAEKLVEVPQELICTALDLELQKARWPPTELEKPRPVSF